MSSTVAFDRVGHCHRVPVQVGGDTFRFLVDTGIGITLVSSAIAARDEVVPTGRTFAGQRMSGQVVECPLVRLPAMRLGSYGVTDHVAGMVDLGDEFDGILGPGFFGDHAFTVDPDRETLFVDPAPTADGFVVPLEIRPDGPSIAPFAPLVLPSGRTVTVEVDTGSGSLILATRYLAECGLSLDDPSVETSTGTDETGHRWTRHYATIAGSVHLAAAPQTAQEGPRVMFQDIIYDGLIGTDYLDRYRVTYDFTGARMILSPRSA
jgi:Aspartyl protease